jgi:2-octaprenyl-6-methoxyphenol hydroxylase
MTKKNDSDVIIVGAGLTGITMAISLVQHNVKVTVIESGDIKALKSKKSDGRTCAISHGSSKIFKQMNLWDDLRKNAEPILDIRVTDGESPLFVHYDYQMVGDNPMGYIIENSKIRNALFSEAEKYKNLQIIDKIRYKDIEFNENNVVVSIADNKKLKTNLLIAADGRNSNIRKLANIKNTSYDYKQHGIVCTVKHEKNHNGVAVEKFLPAGPFAILPMHGGHHSSLVWTEPSDLAPIYLKMNNKEFIEQITERFDGYLGKLELTGDRFSYPLSLVLAKKIYFTQTCISRRCSAWHPPNRRSRFQFRNKRYTGFNKINNRC